MLTHENSNAVKPARVVTLGAGGFVALDLIRHLRAVNVDCRPIGSKEVDLTASAAAEGLKQILAPHDAVVMTAALTPDRGRDLATLMKNLKMAESFCATLAAIGCAHVIYISSDAVYDPRVPLIDEETACDAVDLYALMHIAREKMLEHTCRAAGIPLAVLRPCAVYGAGDTHNSYGPNRFVRGAVEQNRIMLFGEGEEQRDHVFIGDLARIINLSLLHRSTGVLNVVSGRSFSFKSVALCVSSILKRNIEIASLPRTSRITHRHFDNTAALKSFPGFEPTSLEDGLRRSIGAS